MFSNFLSITDTSSLQLTFTYLMYLKVITVQVKVTSPSSGNNTCISGR